MLVLRDGWALVDALGCQALCCNPTCHLVEMPSWSRANGRTAQSRDAGPVLRRDRSRHPAGCRAEPHLWTRQLSSPELTSVRSSTPTAGYRSGEGNEPSPCCGHPGRINALILRLQRMGCRTRVKQTRCVTYVFKARSYLNGIGGCPAPRFSASRTSSWDTTARGRPTGAGSLTLQQ